MMFVKNQLRGEIVLVLTKRYSLIMRKQQKFFSPTHNAIFLQGITPKPKKYEEAFKEAYGFNLIPVNATNMEQVLRMMANCRKTCKEWIQNLNDSQIPEEIKNLGGYEDVISDRFGNRFDTCDLGRMKFSLRIQ